MPHVFYVYSSGICNCCKSYFINLVCISYLINFILDFLDASAGYYISFHTFVIWNFNWRKENAASYIFGCAYCTAESAVVGTKRPYSISILNFPGADSVCRFSCLTFVQTRMGVL